MLSSLDQFLQRVLSHRYRFESTDDRDRVPANRDQGPGQFLDVASGPSLLANDSAVDPSDLGLILSKVIMQIDNLERIVIVEQGERPRRGESSAYRENHVLLSECEGRIRRIGPYTDID